MFGSCHLTGDLESPVKQVRPAISDSHRVGRAPASRSCLTRNLPPLRAGSPSTITLDPPRKKSTYGRALPPQRHDRVLNVIVQLRNQGTAVLLVEQLLEKALAAADRVYALVQGHIVLEAPTSEANLPQRLERAYFGHEAKVDVA